MYMRVNPADPLSTTGQNFVLLLSSLISVLQISPYHCLDIPALSASQQSDRLCGEYK
jgi:hypothetical protein